MIATKVKQATFEKELAMISTLRSKIQNVTVKLRLKDSRFNATGVILTSDDNRVYVLTALHNVYVLAEKENAPEWSDALVTSFKDKIKIYYGAHDFGNEPANVAAITVAKPIHLDPAKKNWEYDILLLKSETPEFKTYAATAGNAVYPSFSDAGEFVTQAWQYLDKGAVKTPSKFAQTGYGKIERFRDISEGGRRPRRINKKVFPADQSSKNRGTNLEGKLQYRIAVPTNAETTSAYRQIGDTENYEEFKHCIVLPADANDSTEEGDSGGPLFIAHYITSPKGYKLDLIGITLGADMETSKTPCPTDPSVRVNNLATSLAQFYSLGAAVLE